MSKKIKAFIIFLVVAVIVAAAVFFVKKFMKKDSESEGRLVYVESVKNITGAYVGLDNRYMGIVEAQETKQVEKDGDKKVKEIFVKIGDVVKKDDPLFSYDTDEMELDLQKMELELDNIKNTISGYNDEINDLIKQRELAPAEDNLNYTSQINNLYAMVKECEYELSTKQLEIDRQRESVNSATVFSPMDGVIKKINQDNNSGYQGGGENGFITIMANGDYRVKGTISETNIGSIMAGTPVIVRSRVDQNVVWKGAVSKIDYEPQSSGNNDYYGGMSGESASKYTFYVNLEDCSGLMLGQHLYIELDHGQSVAREGLYLSSYYLVQDGNDYYVWARDNNKKIEKRKITVGEYIEEEELYQITDGLSESDYIAFPDGNISEGCKTTTNYEDIMNQMDDIDDFDGGFNGGFDDSFDGGYDNYDGGMVPDGAIPAGDIDSDAVMMPDGSYDYPGEDGNVNENDFGETGVNDSGRDVKIYETDGAGDNAGDAADSADDAENAADDNPGQAR